MKKISLILSLLCLTCSMSFGQILQWTKTITAPKPGLVVEGVSSSSKTASSVSLIIYWFEKSNSDRIGQFIWFGSRGALLHNELIPDNENFLVHSISSSRITLIKTSNIYPMPPDNKSNVSMFSTYTRRGSVITRNDIDTGASQYAFISDETGFFAFQKSVGDTWIVKRYIF